MLRYQFSTSGIFFSLCIVTINVKKKIKEDGIKNLDARLIQPKLKNLYMTSGDFVCLWACLFICRVVWWLLGLTRVLFKSGMQVHKRECLLLKDILLELVSRPNLQSALFLLLETVLVLFCVVRSKKISCMLLKTNWGKWGYHCTAGIFLVFANGCFEVLQTNCD